ncbi:SH3 domain-containing protein [Patescibacteria group bacterium]|nr:SH3 domain-containing protein [Patescibacteria group bacterium]MBU1123204.1 SH3 domain-containing protein [Patescibacteria group bacterium]MBU1911802.1 SH3 domain-containing protein [Patescibacteria group bacterium]
MYTARRRRRSTVSSPRPLVAFLLIASFGILFVGCSPSEEETPQEPEEFTFTADDVAKFKELSQKAEEGLEELNEISGPKLHIEEDIDSPVIDLSMAKTYSAIRSGPAATGEDLYRVTNEFLNVRSAPSITSEVLDRILEGETVSLIEFVDAAWAHVKLPNDREGYVAQRYIAKLTSESQMALEREKYKDLYYVDFGFLNVRKSADTNSEKIGELDGQAFVRVLSMDKVWARIPFEGKEGYVAAEYLTPFLPNFRVRQDEFTFPVLQYRVTQNGVLDSLPVHIDSLKQAGLKLITLREFKDLLLKQEERDARLDPNSMAIVISGITTENIDDVSDVLRASGLKATLLLETKLLGLDGITQKTIINLIANGHDLQSTGHTGDDLRSLTNAQVDLELKQSRKILEEYTGRPVFAVGYPMGGVNSRVEKKAEESGYLIGIGSGQERTFHREQLLRIPSFMVSASASAEEVVGLVKGE